MEGKIHLPKKPAAGAARIGILYRSPPLENVQNFRKGGGSVGISPDMFARNAVRGSRMQDLWRSIVMKVHKLKEMGPPLHRYSNSSAKKIPIEMKPIKKQPRHGEASFQAPRQAFCDPISKKSSVFTPSFHRIIYFFLQHLYALSIRRTTTKEAMN